MIKFVIDINNIAKTQKVLAHVSLQGLDSIGGHLLTPLGNKPFENTVGKGEIARNKKFLLFPQCFLPIWISFCQFPQI